MDIKRLAPPLAGALLFFAGVGAAWHFAAPAAPQQGQSKAAPAAAIGGDFVLLNGEGKEATRAVFAGKPHVLMFGFTHCPDICPAGLARMANWQKALGAAAQAASFAFVTVDPERDTPEVLRRYVGYFSKSVLPLSGSPTQTQAMLKKYGVYAQKRELAGGGYTIDHHSAMFLFDGDGAFVEFIYVDDNDKTALAKLRRLIDAA